MLRIAKRPSTPLGVFLLSYCVATTALCSTAPLDYQPLIATGPASGNRFGNALAMNDRWLVVGEDGANGPAFGGRAWVFEKVGSSWVPRGELVRTGMLTSSSLDDGYGSVVAIYGNTIVVTANLGDIYSGTTVSHNAVGTVSVFEYNAALAVWEHTATLAESSLASGAEFGHGLAIWMDTIVVGAIHDGGGTVFVYRKQGSAWVKTQSFQQTCFPTPHAGQSNTTYSWGGFGGHLAYVDGVLTVQVPMNVSINPLLYVNVGAVFVYGETCPGTFALQDYILPTISTNFPVGDGALDPADDFLANFLGFGAQISIAGPLIYISAPGAAARTFSGLTVPGAGRVFVYERVSASLACDGTSFQERANLRLQSPDPGGARSFGLRAEAKVAGMAVGEASDNLGPDEGTAWLFVRDDRSTPTNYADDRWSCGFELCTGTEAVGDEKGIDVAVNDALEVAVGSRSKDVVDAMVSYPKSGAVEMFDLRLSDFMSYGNGCAGCGGMEPSLCLGGNATADGHLQFAIENGIVDASMAFVLLGASMPNPPPVRFGCPILVQPPFSLLIFPVLANPLFGQSISFGALVPSNVPSGVTIRLQALMTNQSQIANPQCVSATAGVVFTTH